MTRISIFNEIEAERAYQDGKWGGKDVDDTHNGPYQWTTYINNYATAWYKKGVPFGDLPVEEFRKSMIKVAALAIAAIEQVDRIVPEEDMT